MRRHNQKGQALVFVVIAMGIFLIGSLGLAIDGGQLFIHRQMAQAAADAAAQAGIMSIFDGTNTVGATQFPTTGFTCTTTATSTPCVYARLNGFGAANTDTVSFTFPTSVPGVWLWGTPAGLSSPGYGYDRYGHAASSYHTPENARRRAVCERQCNRDGRDRQFPISPSRLW